MPVREPSYESMPSVDEMLDMMNQEETASGEAPSEPGVEPAAEAADLETAEGTAPQPRDEQGRFVARDDDEEEAPPEEAAPQDGEEAPEAQAEPAQPIPEETAQPEAGEYPSFSVRSYGRDYEIPGSMVGEDGIFIPTPSVAEVQRLLSQGLGARDRESQLRAQIDQVRNEAAAELIQAQKIVGEFDQLRQLYRENPDAVIEWFENVEKNWDLIQANAKAEMLQAQLEARDAQPSVDEAQAAQAMQDEMDQVLNNAIAQIGSQPEFRQIDQQEMLRRIINAPGILESVFRRAEQDLPEIGVRAGEAYYDLTPIVSEFEYRRSLMPAAPSPAAAKAKQRNQAAVKEAIEAPPVSPASGGDAPSTEKEIPAFKTKEEANAWIDKESNWR